MTNAAASPIVRRAFLTNGSLFLTDKISKENPTDVLAGWTAGVAWAFGCWAAFQYFRRDKSAPQKGDAT